MHKGKIGVEIKEKKRKQLKSFCDPLSKHQFKIIKKTRSEFLKRLKCYNTSVTIKAEEVNYAVSQLVFAYYYRI